MAMRVEEASGGSECRIDGGLEPPSEFVGGPVQLPLVLVRSLGMQIMTGIIPPSPAAGRVLEPDTKVFLRRTTSACSLGRASCIVIVVSIEELVRRCSPLRRYQ